MKELGKMPHAAAGALLLAAATDEIVPFVPNGHTSCFIATASQSASSREVLGMINDT